MNDFQKTLYSNLMTLCSNKEQEAFYYVDQSMGANLYRIFLYRMASYTEFQQPGALECRGHTFRIDAEGNALELVSMPINKFFNHGENPFVMGLDLGTIVEVMDKLDGSLISSVRVSDKEFFLKSKGSFYSGQAQAATKLLATAEYEELRFFIEASMLYDYTVNLEYMAPDNRIVIGYMQPTLKVLNVRDNKTGDYIAREAYKLSEQFRVPVQPVPVDGEAWLAATYASQDDIEGYVARLSCGTWFKVKTEKYCALHHTKDSITIPRRLFEACVNGGADDLRAMFASDALAVMQINEMDELVRSIYNHIHGTTNRFHAAHHHEDRKTYALAGQAYPVIQADGTFGIVMNYYLDKEADIESFMIKNYKKFGIKDEAPTTAE